MKDGEEFYTVRGYQTMRQKKRLLTPSMEDYLEMIYRSCMEEGYTRINILAGNLHVQAPSATRTVQKLSRLGLVSYQKYGIIQLTEKGKEIGEFLLMRHNTVESFLRLLGVKETLMVETETIEHHISNETLEKMARFQKFVEENEEVSSKLQEYMNSDPQ